MLRYKACRRVPQLFGALPNQSSREDWAPVNACIVAKTRTALTA